MGEKLLVSLLGREESEVVATPLRVGEVAKTFEDGVPALWRSLVRKRPKGCKQGAGWSVGA